MLGDHRRKEKDTRPYWKRQKSIFYVGWIELKVRFRALNRETKGMLPFFLFILVAMILLTALPYITAAFEPAKPHLPSCVISCYHKV